MQNLTATQIKVLKAGIVYNDKRMGEIVRFNARTDIPETHKVNESMFSACIGFPWNGSYIGETLVRGASYRTIEALVRTGALMVTTRAACGVAVYVVTEAGRNAAA